MTRKSDAIAVMVIVAVVTLTYLPVLTSGDKILLNNDFFQYASRHESVAQSVRLYQTLPLRSHWLGGGFPTIADPEDPTLNPLVLFSVVLGAVKGIKAIGYLAMLIGGLSTYGLARQILGYTRWGALFSALVFATCLFVPSRIAGGNPNETYGAWLPLCLLLVGLAAQGRRWALAILPVVFYTMISDGKLAALMAMLYVGVVCLLGVVPRLRVLSPNGEGSPRLDHRPLMLFLVAIGLTILIGLPRLLPALEMISDRGGIATMVVAHPQTYSAEGVNAYSFDELWKGVRGYDRGIGTEMLNRDLVTVGVLPLVLSGVALLVFWRRTLAWGIVLALFSWLILAHHAPVDLLAALWNLPVFDAIYRPYKYFSFQIAFTLAIVAGQSFHLLQRFGSRRVEGAIAVILIAVSVGFLYPRSTNMLAAAFVVDQPAVEKPREGFFNVVASDLGGIRPTRANPYLNVLRNVGTLTAFTPVPLATTVAPAYFIGAQDQYIPNPAYRGEAYFVDADAGDTVAATAFQPNSMAVLVDVKAPGTLVVNQNYHRDWHADRGALSDFHGLLALRLDEPGRYSVQFDYRPRSFYAGVAGMLVGLLGLAAMWRWRPRGWNSGLVRRGPFRAAEEPEA